MILVLKYKWFDMIASGEKKEEYRVQSRHNLEQFWRWADGKSMEIEFRRGYTKTAIKVYCQHAAMMLGRDVDMQGFELREEWGFEPGKDYIVYRWERVENAK